MLNTSWYVRSIILFHKLLFSWIEYDDLKKKIQETYNSRLRERYEDDPSTHPDLWMEVGSSGGPNKNRVYGLSNTTAYNLRSARSVSTVESSQSISSSQSKEFVALQQHTTQFTEKYDHLSVEYAQLKVCKVWTTQSISSTIKSRVWTTKSGLWTVSRNGHEHGNTEWNMCA
jgi:hypothetical protein